MPTVAWPASHNIGGVVVGADTRVADDRVTLGVSVAAADMSTKGRDGSDFSGDVRALDVGGYLDATYSRGYLSAAVRYTDLRHDTRRSVSGIDGLQQRCAPSTTTMRSRHGWNTRSRSPLARAW